MWGLTHKAEKRVIETAAEMLGVDFNENDDDNENKPEAVQTRHAASLRRTERIGEDAIGLERTGEDVRFAIGRQRAIVSDKILSMFKDAINGNLTGKSIKIGTLSNEGKKVLENLSGLKFKDNVDFRLNPSDLIHIFNNHFGDNEKDKGKNIPLSEYDIKRIVDVLCFPNDIVFGVDNNGRNVFYFFLEDTNGTYNLMEIYSDKRGNLTAKTYYKTKKGVSRRVMDVKSLLSTSKTYSDTTFSGAKIPQIFDITLNFDENFMENSQGGEDVAFSVGDEMNEFREEEREESAKKI